MASTLTHNEIWPHKCLQNRIYNSRSCGHIPRGLMANVGPSLLILEEDGEVPSNFNMFFHHFLFGILYSCTTHHFVSTWMVISAFGFDECILFFLILPKPVTKMTRYWHFCHLVNHGFIASRDGTNPTKHTGWWWVGRCLRVSPTGRGVDPRTPSLFKRTFENRIAAHTLR